MKRTKFALQVTVACALATMIGCGSQPKNAAKNENAPKTDAKTPAQEEHTHGSGPHGGTITDWGGGAFHVEFTVNHDKKEATIYILGGDEKSPAPIKTEKIHLVINDPATELDLTAQPLDGEKEGASRFIGTHDNLGKVQEFAGTISGEVEGTPYTGDFKEVAETKTP
ncbi:MAG: hypothetical protein K8R36_03895 [Planctomycetales bacterium]|nr:hypothetical protein [Planctomycetales bacterium]